MPDKIRCPRCYSADVIKYGHHKKWKKGKQYKVQMYQCNNTGHQFYLKRVKK